MTFRNDKIAIASLYLKYAKEEMNLYREKGERIFLVVQKNLSMLKMYGSGLKKKSNYGMSMMNVGGDK
jgi:hypothetical protein